MNDDYVSLIFDVFTEVNQRTSVRKDITIKALVNEIANEFQLDAKKITLYLYGIEQSLDPKQSLEALGFLDGDHLVVGESESPPLFGRQKLDNKQAKLTEIHTGTEFALTWTPAIIGRPTTRLLSDLLLAVDVSSFPGYQSVSRRHAQVIFEVDTYYLQQLSPYNTTKINKRPISSVEKHPLTSGDVIQLGKSGISLTFQS